MFSGPKFCTSYWKRLIEQRECKSQREWTDTLCSKEKFESVYVKRQEAVIRRERMKQYSFSHRVNFTYARYFQHHLHNKWAHF